MMLLKEEREGKELLNVGWILIGIIFGEEEIGPESGGLRGPTGEEIEEVGLKLLVDWVSVMG